MVKKTKLDSGKKEALKKEGGLNPQADKVKDELFKKHNFFDPNDLMQVKYEMLRRVHHDGLSVTDVARAFGFSRPSFYKTQKAFAKSGLAGLLPQKSGPKAAHKLTGEVIDFIERIMEDDGCIRAPKISALVQKEFGLKVHPRSIERALLRKKKKGATF